MEGTCTAGFYPAGLSHDTFAQFDTADCTRIITNAWSDDLLLNWMAKEANLTSVYDDQAFQPLIWTDEDKRDTKLFLVPDAVAT